MSDNEVTDEEFQLILEELEKYKTLEEEIRTKKKILTENEERLIERGRQGACEPFRRLVEKNNERVKEMSCPKFRCSFSSDISDKCD